MNAAQSGGHAGGGGMGKKGSQMEELVAISPERRNWRGIFIALLVIAAVFSLIIFSIFLLSPEDEGLRIRGRRLILSDILGKSLQWKPFNGTWSNDAELVFRDPTGGLSILNLDNHTTRVLMTNSTFRQLNAESFVVSPDQKYVLLISDSNAKGARHHVYEVQTANTFPLGPTENIAEAPHLQYVIWAPSNLAPTGAPAAALAQAPPIPQGSAPFNALPLTSYNMNSNSIQQQQKLQLLLQQQMQQHQQHVQQQQQQKQQAKSQNNIETFSTSSSSMASSLNGMGAMGGVGGSATVTTTAGGSNSDSILLNNIQPAAIAGKPTPYNYQTSTNGASNSKVFTQNQAIAFVHENDIYYKPKVQGELVCRITTTGVAGLVYNGIPDWTYENIPELDSRQKSMEFSPDGLYLAFLTFNDSEVTEYKYTWMSEENKYPAVLSQRYPKAGTNNPNVTVNVVNLSVLKYIFPTQIKLPSELLNGSYIGGLTWASPIDLSVTITNRGQTKASTVVCRAPDFSCQLVHTEVTVNDGWVLPNEKPIFSNRISAQLKSVQQQLMQQQGAAFDYVTSFHNITNGQNTYEIKNGGYLLKRLPVLDGIHGHYRHVNFISSLDRRPVPLTMGRFEVTEIVGWDEANEIVYFMAAPEKRPGERHLYRISVKLNMTQGNRTYVTSSQPTCLTCDNTAATFKLRKFPQVQYDDDDSSYSNRVDPQTTTSASEESKENEDKEECHYERPNNCLYNKVYFSKDYSYYVQECLGPESPSVYLVDTQTNTKIYVLNPGDSLRYRLNQLALPQIRTFSVEIRNGFHAQVRLYLPPGMREEEEVAFPLILQIDSAPGSQLVTEKFRVDWNWYLCSQRSFIVAQIDGRGSGFQGELLRTQIHGKLGKPEVEDQLGVLTYLRDNLKFIDPTRICAYGWGYGGYATTMTLIDDSQQILQCGVAVNPIVSFGYHYSFFTERYIPLKGDYLRALQEADLTMKAGNVKGKNLMLMHGTADTFVHQEHSLMLVRSLVDQQVKFRHQVYPDEDHGITKSLSHVYRTMEWYFDECFGPNDDGEWDPTGLFVFKQ